MGREAIEKLLEAISYPDRAGLENGRVVLLIDGSDVVVEEVGRYLRFTAQLDAGESELPEFAGYVPGRIYKESATLAVDAEGRAYLWQEAMASQDGQSLARAFEAFLASCDWWRERLESGRADSEVHFQDVLIRP